MRKDKKIKCKFLDKKIEKKHLLDQKSINK